MLNKSQIEQAVKFVLKFVNVETPFKQKEEFASALKSRLNANKDNLLVFGMDWFPAQGEIIYEALKKANVPFDILNVAEVKVGFFDGKVSCWSNNGNQN